jgi:hypothetical protein
MLKSISLKTISITVIILALILGALAATPVLTAYAKNHSHFTQRQTAGLLHGRGTLQSGLVHSSAFGKGIVRYLGDGSVRF